MIGLELGSVWKRLGAEVTILEALPDFLALADAEVAKTALKEFKKQGLDIKLGAKVSKTEITGSGDAKQVVLSYTDAAGEQTLTVDKLLVAVGRKAATKNLLAEGTGVKVTDRARSRSMGIATPAWMAYGRSVTACAARCWRTRASRKASRSPS